MVRLRQRSVVNQITDSWHLWLAPVIFLVQALRVWVWYESFANGLSEDAALFLYGGRLIVEGQMVYQHLFDIKPPAIYLTTSVFALLANGDPYAMILLSQAAEVVVLAATLGGVAVLGYELTGDRKAVAIGTAGIAISGHLASVALDGPTTKVWGTAAIVLAAVALTRERPVTSGVSLAVAPLYWQPLGLPALLVLAGWNSHSRRSQYRALAGALTATVAVVLPVIAAGAAPEMFVQAIVIPLLTDTGVSVGRGLVLNQQFPVLYPWVTLGVVGGAVGTIRSLRNRSWEWVLTAIPICAWILLWIESGGLRDYVFLLVVTGFGITLAINAVNTSYLPWTIMIGLTTIVFVISVPKHGVGLAGEMTRIFNHRTQSQCYLHGPTIDVFLHKTGIERSAVECFAGHDIWWVLSQIL